MFLSRIYFTNRTDKLLLLWVLCTIDWCRQNNEKITPYNLERLLGAKAFNTFKRYLPILTESDYVTPATITLTPKGERIVRNWRKYKEAILDV
jgi:hypothetical protein